MQNSVLILSKENPFTNLTELTLPIQIANNLEEARTALAKERPKLVIIDQEINSESLISDMREPYPKLNFIILADIKNLDQRADWYKQGYHDYIIKPLSSEEVIKKIENAITILDQKEEILKLSTIDGLTRVANRRFADEILAREWKRSFREQVPLAVIFADLDHFKAYRQQYGQQKTDESLRKIANSLKEHVRRPGDLIARYNIDKFIFVLPNTNSEGVYKVASELQKSINKLNIENKAGDGKDLTISLGTARSDSNSYFSIDELINAADRALQEAKERGRDQIVVGDVD